MRRASNRRGANAVEFALVMPVFLALIAGIVDYGWYFHTLNQLTTAVRDGARTAAVTPVADDPVQAGSAVVSERLVAAGVGSPEVEVALGDAPPNRSVTVTATLPWAPLIGLLPTPPRASTSLAMRMEDQS